MPPKSTKILAVASIIQHHSTMRIILMTYLDKPVHA